MFGAGIYFAENSSKAISMYMELEEVLDVQYIKTDLVTSATGKRSLFSFIFDKNQIRTGFHIEFFR